MSDILSAQNDMPVFLQEEERAIEKQPSSPLEPPRSPSIVNNPSAQPNTANFESIPPSVNVKRHSRSLDLPVSELKESEWSGIHHQRSNSDTSKDLPKEPSYIDTNQASGLVPESLAAALPLSPSPSATSNTSRFSLALGRRQPFGDRKKNRSGSIEVTENYFFHPVSSRYVVRDANGLAYSRKSQSNLLLQPVVRSQLVHLSFHFQELRLNPLLWVLQSLTSRTLLLLLLQKIMKQNHYRLVDPCPSMIQLPMQVSTLYDDHVILVLPVNPRQTQLHIV